MVNKIATMRTLSGHPNMSELVEVFEDDEGFHVILEYLPGKALFDQICDQVGLTGFDRLCVRRSAWATATTRHVMNGQHEGPACGNVAPVVAWVLALPAALRACASCGAVGRSPALCRVVSVRIAHPSLNLLTHYPVPFFPNVAWSPLPPSGHPHPCPCLPPHRVSSRSVMLQGS